jgi:excisionase family DNA binding protein
MLDSDPRAAGEKDYGAQEAAHLLGIHRSTLHHAVKRGLIVPDFQTPGRHYRFRTATLEAFGKYLQTGAATNEARLVAPVQILADLAHTLARSDGTEKACQEAVDLLCTSHVGIDMACVAQHAEDAPNGHGLRLMAHRGFPSWFFQDYAGLRPTMRLAVHRVMRTMEPVLCADTMEPHGADDRPARLVRRANIRSYAVLPIPSASERTRQAYGVLVIASKTPRLHMRVDDVLLKGITDQLAVALAGAAMPASPDTRVTKRVVQRAFATLANGNGAAAQENCQRLQDIFLEETGAEEVFSLGFGDVDIIKRDIRLDSQLHELGCRACANDELISDVLYGEELRPLTAAAASVLLWPHHRAAVGAVWGGVRRVGEPEHALLVSFASAYALAGHIDMG